MKKHFLSLLFFSLIVCLSLQAQDTLPKFSVKTAGNKRIIVSWINNFKVIKQISIQRSFDSLTGYKTILTIPDPATPQNGYMDTKASNGKMFYRLYILLDNGVYLFSDAKRPVPDTLNKQAKNTDIFMKFLRRDPDGKIETLTGIDSTGSPDAILKNKDRPDVFVPSVYVFVYKDGYVRVNLPEDEKKYSIKFFEDDGSFLFELKDIKEREFNIDKSDFYHAGWFRFELYSDGKLIEKHKFYLEKEF